MKPWSDNPVHKEFCIKFFVDTNLLVYLIDSTYKSLNDFIELLNNTPFARIISSRYVIFEFVGVRKREHYLRIAAENSEKTSDSQINFSSLIKYRDSYNHPNAIFEDVVGGIEVLVNAEIEKIARDYNIDFEYSSLHEDQLGPTINICLASKISNYDSLVLVSSFLPQPKETNEVILLTNDSAFVNSYTSANIAEKILSSHSIRPPQLEAIDNMPESIKLVGKEATDRVNLEQKIKELLCKLIIEKLKRYYLGKTFVPHGPDFPKDCICFKLVESYNLPQNVYVTVVGKDLDFIYSTRKSVTFWYNGKETIQEFTSPNDQKINISYRIIDVDEYGNEKSVSQEILDALRVEGNLVFVHPDSAI